MTTIFGPPLGGVIGLALLTLPAAVRGHWGNFIFSFYAAPLIAVASYTFGLIPAIVHSTLMMILGRYTKSKITWLLLSPLLGSLSCIFVLAVEADFSVSPELLRSYLIFSLFGAAGALATALIAAFFGQPPTIFSTKRRW